ncbi:MAG: hypothetical protein HRT77_04915 [Halioglobus sp.]|nr:hypothetical protein [Halioglobus sp.]
MTRHHETGCRPQRGDWHTIAALETIATANQMLIKALRWGEPPQALRGLIGDVVADYERRGIVCRADAPGNVFLQERIASA